MEEQKLRVAVLGGSFDPPTLAHIQIAEFCSTVYDEVWVVPCGTRTDKKHRSSAQNRLEMTRLAFEPLCKEQPGVWVNDVEIRHGSMIMSYFLMEQFKKDHPERDFFFVIGSDLLPDLRKWDYGPELVEHCPFCVLQRKGYPCDESLFPKKVEYWPEFEGRELSSTQIRNYVE